MRTLSNTIGIPDYLYKNSNDSEFPLKFVVHDGYMALPNVMYPFHPGNIGIGRRTDC